MQIGLCLRHVCNTGMHITPCIGCLLVNAICECLSQSGTTLGIFCPHEICGASFKYPSAKTFFTHVTHVCTHANYEGHTEGLRRTYWRRYSWDKAHGTYWTPFSTPSRFVCTPYLPSSAIAWSFQHLLRGPSLMRLSAANTLLSWKRHRTIVWKQQSEEKGARNKKEEMACMWQQQGMVWILCWTVAAADNDNCVCPLLALSWADVRIWANEALCCSYLLLTAVLELARWGAVIFCSYLSAALLDVSWTRQNGPCYVEGRLETTSQVIVFGVWDCYNSWAAGCIMDKAHKSAFWRLT